MKKLTKNQRLEAYVYCYLTCLSWVHYGACLSLKHWCELSEIGCFNYIDMAELFPELATFKPKKDHVFWFRSMKQRLRAIETCIRLCEQAKD